jgi:hypothetical protein
VSAAARRARGAVAATVLVVSGCASAARRDADVRFVRGDAAGAAAAYEALLDTPLGPVEEDVVLLRAATSHALANLERGDFARSRELLGELAARHPSSPHGPTARLLLALLDQLDAQTAGLAEARSTADELLARARRQKQTQEAAVGSAGELELLRQSLAELERQIQRLQSETRSREAELAKLRQEIEMLKAIDLERDAPPPRPPG